MSKMTWDQTGEKLYETGVEQCALYPQDSSGAYPHGYPWNGLTAVNESPSGAEETALYANDSKYLGLRSKEDYGCTIEAYTYPEEFEACDGSKQIVEGVVIGQQTRTPFGLAYKTLIGNDTQGDSYGYKLHLVWNGTAAPSERAHATVNDSPEAASFSWEVATTPVPITAVANAKPTSSMTLDSTKVDAAKLTALEGVLYGTENGDPHLPTPDEVIRMLQGVTGATGATGETGETGN